MKERQPVNPQQSGTRRDRMNVQPLALAAEISGYCDIGMKREALRLTRRVLENRRISSEEFGEAVRTIGILSDFEKWKPELEAAYNRQSRKFKRKTRPLMVEMYGSMGEWETATQFLSVRKPSSAGEVFFGMEALLELNKLEDAKKLATLCRRALSFVTDRFEQSLLLDALARFFARTHQWDQAIAAWQYAPLNEPFRRDALSGIVKIHLGRAFEAIDNGLKALAELKRNPERSLCLPENDLGLTCDAERELLKFKRGIERLLPEKARKELGISFEKS
jgi:uncharacterized protein HemY